MAARRGSAPLAALALVAALTGPAYADHVEHQQRLSGLEGCGFWSTEDPWSILGGVEEQEGQIYCEWAAADVDGAEPAAVDVHAWIQVNKAAPDPDDWHHWSAHCHASGTGAAAGTCLIRYSAGSWDDVYFCERVTMTTSQGTDVHEWDDDADPGNGVQCALAITVEG